MTEKEKLFDNLILKSGKSKEEIEQLVADKVNELSGLVSEEGAIYIIANELDVKLDSDRPKRDANLVKIEEITEPKTPTSLECKVIRKYDKVTFSSKTGSEGSVQSMLVGDETGIVRLTFWNDQTDLIEDVHDGDILRVSNAYTRENSQNPQRIDVHFGQYSSLEINPEGVEIILPEFKSNLEFTEKKISELEEGDRNVKITVLVTDFDIPRFYLACPHTFKKVFQDEGKYISPEHGEVVPIKVPIVNILVDDGSGTIAAVGFRDRAEQITNLKSEEIVALTEDIEKYKHFSKQMVGAKLVIAGNLSQNNMTGEPQLLVNQVLLVELKGPQDEEEKLDDLNSEEQEVDLDDLDDLDIEEIEIDDDLL